MIAFEPGAVMAIDVANGKRAYAQLVSRVEDLADGWVVILLDMDSTSEAVDLAMVSDARILTAGRFSVWSSLFELGVAKLIGITELASCFCMPWHRTPSGKEWVYESWDGNHEVRHADYLEHATRNNFYTAGALVRIAEQFLEGGPREERVMTEPWSLIHKSCTIAHLCP